VVFWDQLFQVRRQQAGLLHHIGLIDYSVVAVFVHTLILQNFSVFEDRFL